MSHESEAIPFAAEDLRGESLLVLAPHPDDEIIGCGGLLALHLREHRKVRVVIATDGTAADGGPEASAREQESRAGLALLAGGQAISPVPSLKEERTGGIACPPVEPEFLRFPDRRLGAHLDQLRQRLAEILRDERPDLILAPSPIEIHPDHFDLSRALCELLQRDELLHADLAVSRVAFYEVGQPLRPNAFVDITSVADAKYSAIAAHTSQTAVRDYTSFSRGLNAYRAMTLPPSVKYAEAYWVTSAKELRTMAFTALRSAVGNARAIEVTAEPLPVSVIVRTKDRPALLREAVDSIRATGYPAEIVVVNDGGATPNVRDVTLVEHAASRGRSEAMNSGVRAARSAFIAFLDDDDLYYPEHLATLTRAAEFSSHVGWYSDAVSAFVHLGENGTYETRSRLRLFAHDFDRELLLVDNYIPLPTLLVPRETFLDAGGFDPEIDLFEDWDFLIRLAQRGTLARVPRVTCEIRHIEGAGSITMEAPEGSQRFREAKLQIWRKHESLIDNDVIADAFERQKRRVNATYNDLVEAKGLRQHLDTSISRLEREKLSLIDQIQSLHTAVTDAQKEIARLHGGAEAMQTALESAQRENGRLGVQVARLDDLELAMAESHRTTTALYAEIARLQELLDTIYQSRTWKLHTIVQKMKGRG